MKYLLDGGSWFEADQMHWRLILQDTSEALERCPKTGKAAAAKRHNLMERKMQAEKELGIKRSVAPVAAAAAPAPKKPTNDVRNVFAALAESEEEEE